MNKDIKALIAIYTILILIGWNIGLKHELNKSHKEKIEIMKIALQNDKLNQEYILILQESREQLNQELENQELTLQEYKSFDKILKEIRLTNNPFFMIALCYPESNLKHNVIHNGKYDKETIGICGIKSYHIGVIPGLNESNINTLKGGEIVLNYFMNKNNGDLFEALKDYKGSNKNLEPVYKTLEIYKEIKDLR